jgi:hypothetical protein
MRSRFVAGITYSTIEVIDCLVPGRDMQTGLAIYNYLRDLTSAGAPRVRRHPIRSEAELWECLERIESDCVKGWKAIIHIEGHASKAGLEVPIDNKSHSQVIAWPTLVDRFRAINIASQFNLGVFMATCEGIEALRPMTIKKPAPYMFLVGPHVQVSAGMVLTAAQAFYNVILTTPDLNRASAKLPREFTTFLAERFFAITYARVLKQQSFGRRKKERVNSLVNMVLPNDAPNEQLQTVREMAKLFALPDRERFEAVQRRYLPAGVSFTFDELVEYARTGKIPD